MPVDFRRFVAHPRYGRGPGITGLDPDTDMTSASVFVHWHSPHGVRIPNTAIVADISKQVPATIAVTHYFDAMRTCADCGRPFIFFAVEQKFWYEVLGFPLESDCVRCVPCRRKQRGLEFHRHRYEEWFHLRDRTPRQDLEIAESALTLIEAGVFGKRVLERVRAILKAIGTREPVDALWERVSALEGLG